MSTATLRDVLTPPRAPRTPLAEVARWEWRRADGGDSIELATAFLAAHGFAVRPLGGPGTATHDLAGAALLLGASALPAELADLPPAPPTPCPAVPDAAVVVYAHAATTPATHQPSCEIGRWTPTWTRAEHAAAVTRIRADIARGDLFF